MNKLFFMLLVVIPLLTACGSGDTGEGYSADTTALNTDAGQLDSTISPMAGERGNPDSTIGATTNTKNPDSNAKIPGKSAAGNN